ncbi:type VII secretion protein EsaA [Actinomycetota bacterium]|nr:type VII secretion protein EsaA [Actinomycetota bacterium]
MRGASTRVSSGARAALLLFLVSLVSVILVPLNSEYQRGVAELRVQESRPVLLDVAVVNEDAGASVDGEAVNLGRGYVTQIESDASARWHVVSRGVAESGLANGGYELMVVIPSDFSGTLVDLAAADPAPIGITYQVNGAGSARVETLAASKGETIVSQLNQQLVDMYVASILGNLRQAQDNVRLLVGVESANAETFTAEVHPATHGLGDDLGLLARGTDGVLATGAGVTGHLDGLAGSAEELVAGQGDHQRSLGELLVARQDGAVTYAAFLESLLAMDGRLLGEEVDRLADELVEIGGSLTAQLDPGTTTATHADGLTGLQQLVDQAGLSVQERADALEALDDTAVLAAYRGAVYAAIDTDGDEAVSLAELAAHARGGDVPASGTPDVDAVLRRAAEAQFALLPYRTVRELRVAADAGTFAHAGGQFRALVPRMSADIAAIVTWEGYADIGPDPGGVVGADIGAAISGLTAAEQALADLTGPGAEHGSDEEVTGDGQPKEPEPGASSPPPSEPDEPQPGAAEAIADLSAAAARYGAEVTRIAQAFRSAAQTVALVQECAAACGSVPELDVSVAVDGIIAASVAQAIDAERAVLTDATGLAVRLHSAMDELTTSYQGLVATSQELGANISGQLDSLATLRESMAQVVARERTVAASVAGSGTMTTSVAAEARTLVAASEELAGMSRAAVAQSGDVLALTTAARADVDELVNGSARLSERSGVLGQALAGGVDASQRFADSFSTVLPHAFSAGVLNERLMAFIAAPVESSPRAPVGSSDVSRPFAWVLITFALCLSAAHTLASVAGRRRAGSPFARDRAAWLGSNVRALGRAMVVAVLLGVGLAWASAEDLAVPRESQLLWAACVVLSCVALTLVAHALVKQWRVVGVGLCVVLLVGYVLVSDAVGAGARSGVPALVARLDPLNHAESAMVAVLGSDPAGIAVCASLVLWAAVGAGLNLLVRLDLRRALRAGAGTAEVEP